MEQIDNIIYSGKIKSFNGRFGFIASVLGETFFHRNELKKGFIPKKKDEVEFQLMLSKQKMGVLVACRIELIKRIEKQSPETIEPKYLVGIVKWFDDLKGFGFISKKTTDFYINESNLITTSSIYEGDVVVFEEKLYKRKSAAINCQPFMTALSKFPPKTQKILLQQYLDVLSNSSRYFEHIKSVATKDTLDEGTKATFIKSAFEMASSDDQYKILFDIKLIDIQKRDQETQIEILQKFLFKFSKIQYHYDKIQSIAISSKILEIAKTNFLNSAYSKAETAYQCKMLADGLITFTSDKQIILLDKYLKELTLSSFDNFDIIVSIAKSAKIDDAAKSVFLKEAFEKVDLNSKIKLLVIGFVILPEEKQNILLEKYLLWLHDKYKLQSSDQSHFYDQIKYIGNSTTINAIVKNNFFKSAFEKLPSQYQYKLIFIDELIPFDKESSENQIKMLQNHMLTYTYLHHFNYAQIKSIALSDKITEKVKIAFIKTALDLANLEFQYKILFDDKLIDIQNEKTESQIEFFQNYLLKHNQFNYTDYEYIRRIARTDGIDTKAKEGFLKYVFGNAKSEYQKKILFEDNLIDIQKESPEIQEKILNQFLIGCIGNSFFFDSIKTVFMSPKIDETTKQNFVRSAYKLADARDMYRFLFVDNFIDIQNEIPSAQIYILQQYLLKLEIVSFSNYEQIKFIYHSEKISDQSKDVFIKYAYEIAQPEYQYKILFEDNLIDIHKETSESQKKIIQKYILKLGKIDYQHYYNEISFIAQTDKILDLIKTFFLNSIFEQADTNSQCEMLGDGLITLSEEIQVLLLKKYKFENENRINSNYKQIKSISRSDKISNLAKTEFLYSIFDQLDIHFFYKMVFVDKLIDIEKESPTSQDELLQKYLIKIGSETHKFYYEIRSIIQTNPININVLDKFINSVFDRADNELRCKMIIDKLIHINIDFDLLANISNYKLLSSIIKTNPEMYNNLFYNTYFQISKLDRLRLWLQKLNPYYNYIEFLQVAWQLSYDERRLLNLKIKEQAKDERLEKFLSQIPAVVLIEKTESTRTFKCKWRNLYYKNGSIQVFLNKTISTEDYHWSPAREEWNLLTQEYFNSRRIDDIIVTVNLNYFITKITGLENIEVKIVMAEVRKHGTTDKKTSISASQISRIIHNISARNQCINFLARQNFEYNVLDVQELVTDDFGSLRRDVSFIFPIPNRKGLVYLIWESVEFEKSKATHIFKCNEKDLERMEVKIKDFIEGNIRTRSRLNSAEAEDLEVKKELQYFCRVNHDSIEYQVWENRLREMLPFLE